MPLLPAMSDSSVGSAGPWVSASKAGAHLLIIIYHCCLRFVTGMMRLSLQVVARSCHSVYIHNGVNSHMLHDICVSYECTRCRQANSLGQNVLLVLEIRRDSGTSLEELNRDVLLGCALGIRLRFLHCFFFAGFGFNYTGSCDRCYRECDDEDDAVRRRGYLKGQGTE